MKDLTSRQKEVLDYIIDFKDRKEYSPTFDEIADNFKVNKKAAYDSVVAIERKGYIERELMKSRSIKVVKII